MYVSSHLGLVDGSTSILVNYYVRNWTLWGLLLLNTLVVVVDDTWDEKVTVDRYFNLIVERSLKWWRFTRSSQSLPESA